MNILIAEMSVRLLGLMQRWKAMFLAASQRSNARHMVLIESLSLGNRRQLYLVHCDHQHFLVGAGADNIGTLIAVPEAGSTSAPSMQSSTLAIGSSAPHYSVGRSATKHGLQLVKRSDEGSCKSPGDGSLVGGLQ